MIAHSETLSRPLYTEPFREMDPARVPKPARHPLPAATRSTDRHV